MMDLFIAILKQILVEKIYAATAAELQHSIYTCNKGVILKFNGYNQKLPVKLKFSIFILLFYSNFIFILALNEYCH